MYTLYVKTAYTANNSNPTVSAMGVQSGRIGADEAIDDADGKEAEELEERLKEKEAKTQAILLEMVRRTKFALSL